MIVAVLTHWRLVLSALAVAASFAAGVSFEGGRRDAAAARQAAADLRAEDARRVEIHAAEAVRLADQTAADYRLGEIITDARSDPDAGLPAFSLRDAARLNALR